MDKEQLILSVSTYDFLNDDGERIIGGSIDVLGSHADTDNLLGRRVAKHTIKKELASKLTNVPCIARVYYQEKINSKGQMSLDVVDVEQIKPYKIDV